MPADLTPPSHPPRILIVSRRSVRKNKYIDFVGEYHLDLLTHHGAAPLILPRTPAPPNLLASLPDFHGLLLCEGEDISPTFRPREPPPPAHVQRLHSSDATPDLPKDRLEFHLVRHCLQHAIPILAICRGCQLLNLCAGGSLLSDLHTVLGNSVRHIDYDNYDAHRHDLAVVPHTPLADWFDRLPHLAVNSYHHQGIDQLAACFAPMGYAPDGLVEAYYDPSWHDVQRGRFVVGLQFHPERMQDTNGALRGEVGRYDYAGCSRVYGAFVQAARAFRDSVGVGGEGAVPWCGRRFEGVDLVAAEGEGWRCGRKGGRRVLGGVTGLGSKYSKEEMERIIRSGASVHGTRVVYNLIHGHGKEGEENEGDNGQGRERQHEARHGSDWRRFERGLLMAESGLKGLQGTREMKAALALLEKLTREVVLGDGPGRGR